jgi:hypothetical protein
LFIAFDATLNVFDEINKKMKLKEGEDRNHTRIYAAILFAVMLTPQLTITIAD